MSAAVGHDFGVVDPLGDFYELHWEAGKASQCRLEEIVQTERGPRRSELAAISAVLWSAVSDRVVRELAEGMGETERPKKIPTLKRGPNRLSPLIGRELAILFWALIEADGDGHTEAILHGWRELAREERWWLYAKAAAPGQRQGGGWRRALFHALSVSIDSRTADTSAAEKKKPWEWLAGPEKSGSQEQAREKAAVAESSQPFKDPDSVPDTERDGNPAGAEPEAGNLPKNRPPKNKKNDSEGGGPRQLKLF